MKKNQKNSIELTVGDLIQESFPSHKLVRQKQIKYKNTQLKFDYYLPELKVYVEVQGEQHFTFNKFYHFTHQDLDAQKYRDMLKTQYVDEVGAKILAIRFDEISALNSKKLKKMILSLM